MAISVMLILCKSPSFFIDVLAIIFLLLVDTFAFNFQNYQIACKKTNIFLKFFQTYMIFS